MDTANGFILWSRNLGRTGEQGPELVVQGIWTVREIGLLGHPTLAIVAIRTRDEVRTPAMCWIDLQEITTVAFHVDAFTGDVSGGFDAASGIAVGKELFRGPVTTTFPLPFEHCGTKNRVLAVVDAYHTLHLFPPCKKVARELSSIASRLSFTAGEASLSGSTLVGWSPSSSGPNTTFSTEQIWSIALSGPVTSVKSVEMKAVASYGRALGDKSTLYKYLNPHLSVVTTASEALVIDTLTGGIVHQAAVSGVQLEAAMVENWLVYSWLSPAGWRLASVELYEDPYLGKGLT